MGSVNMDSLSPIILSLVTFIPAAGGLLILLIPRRDRDIKLFALVISLLAFVASLHLPVHLHRNSFELTNVWGKPTAGVMKDVVLVKGFRKIEADVTPAMDGLTLFHCHQQLHMDYGFKLLFNVA